MITSFQTNKKFWFLWHIIGSTFFPVICLAIILVTSVYEISIFLTIFILSIAAFTFYIAFVSKSAIDIFSLEFDDESKMLHIVFYKYTYKRIEISIPYDKLWYYKIQRRIDIFLGTFSGFNIQVQEDYHSPIQFEFHYEIGGISDAFSDKQFYQIIDKLKEVGHNYFEEHEKKWGTTLF